MAPLAGERCLTAPLDVTRPEEIRAAARAAVERFGGVDVLVNNAGYGEMGVIEEFDDGRHQGYYALHDGLDYDDWGDRLA